MSIKKADETKVLIVKLIRKLLDKKSNKISKSTESAVAYLNCAPEEVRMLRQRSLNMCLTKRDSLKINKSLKVFWDI